MAGLENFPVLQIVAIKVQGHSKLRNNGKIKAFLYL